MSMEEIKAMYDEGEKQGASHMLVAWDDFDNDHYPVYVMPGEDPKTKRPSNGDSVMECYRYSLGWESQSKEWRANHWEFEPVAAPDARVPKVAQTIYELERAKSSVPQFWADWSDAPRTVRGEYEYRAVQILTVADSF